MKQFSSSLNTKSHFIAAQTAYNADWDLFYQYQTEKAYEPEVKEYTGRTANSICRVESANVLNSYMNRPNANF